jgi:hypothetical protein
MTVELDKGIAALRKEFAAEIASGVITHLGTYSCRRKNHSSTAPWSEHSWTDGLE